MDQLAAYDEGHIILASLMVGTILIHIIICLLVRRRLRSLKQDCARITKEYAGAVEQAVKLQGRIEALVWRLGEMDSSKKTERI